MKSKKLLETPLKKREEVKRRAGHRSSPSALMEACPQQAERYGEERLSSSLYRWLLEFWQSRVANVRLKAYRPYHVEISKGRVHAKLFFVPAAFEGEQPGVAVQELQGVRKAFRGALGWVRCQLAQDFKLRRVPELSFELSKPSLALEFSSTANSNLELTQASLDHALRLES